MSLYDLSGALLDSTATDDSGAYAFSPASGSYVLEFIPPAGMAFVPRGQGGDDDADSDVDPISGTTSIVSLTSSQTDVSRDAGLQVLPIFADGFESGDTSAWSEEVVQ
ncbi:MAG: SdrD B-like domain-containing protein [Acidobacteriota bacterium]